AAVAPTLLALAGVKDAAIEKQFSTTGLLAKQPENDSAYSETFYPFSSFGWSPLHSVETSRYHYIDAPTPELYDLTSDPEEGNNIAPQQTATVAVLKGKLQRLLAANPFQPANSAGSHLSPDAAEKLRALGYVSYKSPVSQEQLAKGLADPKDKLGEFNSILEAQDAMRAGDTAGGEALFAKVQQQEPNLYIVHF